MYIVCTIYIINIAIGNNRLLFFNWKIVWYLERMLNFSYFYKVFSLDIWKEIYANCLEIETMNAGEFNDKYTIPIPHIYPKKVIRRL